jgi:hypothetical protein
MRKILVLLCLLAFFFVDCVGQSFINGSEKSKNYSSQKNFSKIITQISQHGKVEGKTVGYGGRTSEQYLRFSRLMVNASDSELVLLTNHYSPVVKAYAFWALSIKGYSEIKSIVEKHLHDRQRFQFQSGCIVENKMINEWFLHLAQQNLTKNEIENYKLIISNF